jgi:hypothetical protein
LEDEGIDGWTILTKGDSSELSSGIYCRVKWLSTDVSEVRTASIIRDDVTARFCTAVCRNEVFRIWGRELWVARVYDFVLPCSQQNENLYSVHIFCHPWWWRQYAPLKRRSTFILHGSISQKTILNIIPTAVRTWSLTKGDRLGECRPDLSYEHGNEPLNPI